CTNYMKCLIQSQGINSEKQHGYKKTKHAVGLMCSSSNQPETSCCPDNKGYPAKIKTEIGRRCIYDPLQWHIRYRKVISEIFNRLTSKCSFYLYRCQDLSCANNFCMCFINRILL